MFTSESRSIKVALHHAEAELVNTREDLVRSVQGVEGEMNRLLGWRALARRKPLVFVGAAFVVGLLLGRRV